MDADAVYLVQTDTTVGFCSQNSDALAAIKERSPTKPFLITTAGTGELKKLTRVPRKQRKTVRRAKKTTFVYPRKNLAVRVVHEGDYFAFLKKFGWLYSTSANKAGEKFDLEFAVNAADIAVYAEKGFSEQAASRIISLGRKVRRLR
jgi:tRNA A37 threonylcarbamoyladenosine synthetase subunit TsaC/SUA5/YrdC